MTELEFGERLKQYRKAKNMTQQELADVLGLSNKSVSRWESGSYPDVATLGPLAKALGVTVDDLLGQAPPLRALERADWQNLLSFAFAIGGGILYFLLTLFTPALICYFIYLGCMAYGVYLQKHYTYHSKWFFRANLLMDFFINLDLLVSPLSITSAGSAIMVALTYLSTIFSGGSVAPSAALLLLLWILLAVLLTALTGRIIRRKLGSGTALPKLRLRREAFSAKKAIPALCPILLTGYWCVFYSPVPLAEAFYRSQDFWFYVLLAVLAVGTVVYLLLTRQKWMLFPAAGMLLICTAFPATLADWVWSKNSGLIVKAAAQTVRTYVRFGRPGWGTFLLMAALAGLYLLCCFVRTESQSKE